MNRRIAIKNMLLVITGAAIIPRQLRSATAASIGLTNLLVTASDEHLLAEVVDTLIPTTDTLGAKDLKVHLFVLLMLNDCHDKKDQTLFLEGLRQIDAFAIAQTGKSFTACSAAERVNLLTRMKSKEATPPAVWAFNRLMRSRTIEGYNVSEYVMTQVRPHQMIPPAYDGFYPVSDYTQTEVQTHG
jgi:hypothetical protein